MKRAPERTKKTKREKTHKNKTLSMNANVIRAGRAFVASGNAQNFSAMCEAGLRLLMRTHHFPETLTADEFEARLRKAFSTNDLKLAEHDPPSSQEAPAKRRANQT